MKNRTPQFKSVDSTEGARRRARNLWLFLGIIGLPTLVLVYLGRPWEAFLWMVISAGVLGWLVGPKSEYERWDDEKVIDIDLEVPDADTRRRARTIELLTKPFKRKRKPE